MMNQTTLEQGRNEINAVGTLITNDIVSENKDGKEIVRGEVVISCEIEGEINEIRFNVYAQDHFGNFSNLEKAMDIPDKATALNPDLDVKVRIIGSVELNEYVRNGEVLSFNRNRAINIHRTDKTTEDQCLVRMRTVIESKEERDEKLFLNVLSVGYKNEIVDVKDGLRVPDNLKDDIDRACSEGDTAEVIYTPTRSVIVKEQEGTVSFGMVIEDESYTYENVLKGITLPEDGYSDEEFAEIVKLRKQQVTQLEAQIAPKAKASNSQSFGMGMSGSESESPFA